MVGGSEEQDVIAVELAYDQAWTAGDLTRLRGLFTSDAVIITPNGDVLTGIAEIEEGLRSVMAQPARKVHASTIDAVHFVTADVAIVDGHAVLDAAAGAESEARLLHRFTDILVRQDGVWRIAHVRASPAG